MKPYTATYIVELPVCLTAYVTLYSSYVCIEFLQKYAHVTQNRSLLKQRACVLYGRPWAYGELIESQLSIVHAFMQLYQLQSPTIVCTRLVFAPFHVLQLYYYIAIELLHARIIIFFFIIIFCSLFSRLGIYILLAIIWLLSTLLMHIPSVLVHEYPSCLIKKNA